MRLVNPDGTVHSPSTETLADEWWEGPRDQQQRVPPAVVLMLGLVRKCFERWMDEREERNRRDKWSTVRKQKPFPRCPKCKDGRGNLRSKGRVTCRKCQHTWLWDADPRR